MRSKFFRGHPSGTFGRPPKGVSQNPDIIRTNLDVGGGSLNISILTSKSKKHYLLVFNAETNLKNSNEQM